MTNLHLKKLTVIGLILLILAVDLGLGIGIYYLVNRDQVKIPEAKGDKLPTFFSCSELAKVFKEYENSNSRNDVLYDLISPGMKMTTATQESGANSTTPSHSETNVQVAGVDEADIVKNDGNYIYTLRGSTKEIVIVKAYPADETKVLSRITFESNETPTEIFIDGNNLMVVGSSYENGDGNEIQPMMEKMIYPYYSTNLTFVKIYSVYNHEKPQIRRDLKFQGTYQTSRKIDDEVYFVLNDYKYWDEDYVDQPELLLPQYQENGDTKPLCNCTDVEAVLPFRYPNYLNIISVSISDYSKDFDKEVILGGSDNVYASLNNLYVANTTYMQNQPILKEMFNYIFPTQEITTVYKFALENGNITYKSKGDVEGTVLNQFSMDEYNDYFRVATTEGHVSRGGGNSSNNVYVLDEELSVTGSVNNIAPGEQIYSARFMGDKGYVVTFQKVDPFFTLDLKDPKNPKILGQLKIPGYSDYLHPLDENHILGLGKNTIQAEEGGFAWYQGIKIAIFDVTDFAHPKEVFKTEIGDRGTDSYALHDHKAFLYDAQKELLVIPVMVAELTEEQKVQSEAPNTYGNYTFQGAYVYQVDVETGFKLKGRVTHYDNGFSKDRYYYYYSDDKSIQRSLYIGDNLYTISGTMIKVNSLSDLKEIKKVEL